MCMGRKLTRTLTSPPPKPSDVTLDVHVKFVCFEKRPKRWRGFPPAGIIMNQQSLVRCQRENAAQLLHCLSHSRSGVASHTALARNESFWEMHPRLRHSKGSFPFVLSLQILQWCNRSESQNRMWTESNGSHCEHDGMRGMQSCQPSRSPLFSLPGATTCAAAPPAGPVYCPCHTNGSRGPGGDHARSSFSSRPCVLRLPHERQPRARRRPRSSFSSRPCVLHLPHERQTPARQRPRAQQLLQKAVCTAPATRKPAAGQAASTRTAAPPEGCVHCACHTKASRGPGGDHARSSSSRRLCVLRLPHEHQSHKSQLSAVWWMLWDEWCAMSAVRWEAWDEWSVVWWVV